MTSGVQINVEKFQNGLVIRQPPGASEGYWAGAPVLFHDTEEGAFYLTYRLRRPRGVEPDRGGEARIARSTDLREFTDIWSVRKEAFGSASIERCALYRGSDKLWRYFVSYVDPADGRWCVAVLEGGRVEELKPERVERIFSAPGLGLEGIKDPWILEENGVYHMFVSVALATPRTSAAAHETLDIYNTGECMSATGLAISRDLRKWEWQGPVFVPTGRGWDGYCRRINSVVRSDGRYLAFYDGSASYEENYEEKTGLAESKDLREWHCLSPEGPAVTSSQGSGSLRYIDGSIGDGEMRLLYEYASADGAHDLRLVRGNVREFIGV